MDRSLYVGVDVGKTGAVATVTVAGDVVFYDARAYTAKTDGKTIYDPSAMADILRRLMPSYGLVSAEILVVIEKQQAMPAVLKGARQGVSSSFSLGEGYGLWQGVCAGVGLPFIRVHPTRWKGRLMDGRPKTKEASLPAAAELYPSVTDQLRGPRGAALDGRADALLLAHYGRVAG